MNWKKIFRVLSGGFALSDNDEISKAQSDYATNALGSWLARQSGVSLTNAEQQANQFSHNEAELAFNRELQASNTVMQRKVEDYRAAGINPMYAADGGVTLPSASAPSSVSPSAGAFNPLEIFSLLGNLRLQNAQIKNINAQTQNVNQDTMKKAVETESIGVMIERTRQEIEGAKLDNFQKSVINKYLDRQQEAELDLKHITKDHYDALVNQTYKKIEKMDFEELEIFTHVCDMQEHINYLISQENLSASQIEDLQSSIYKMNKDAELVGLHISNFDLLNTVSISHSFKAGPFSASDNSYVTLKQLKEFAAEEEERKKNKGQKTGSRSGVRGNRVAYDGPIYD